MPGKALQSPYSTFSNFMITFQCSTAGYRSDPNPSSDIDVDNLLSNNTYTVIRIWFIFLSITPSIAKILRFIFSHKKVWSKILGYMSLEGRGRLAESEFSQILKQIYYCSNNHIYSYRFLQSMQTDKTWKQAPTSINLLLIKTWMFLPRPQLGCQSSQTLAETHHLSIATQRHGQLLMITWLAEEPMRSRAGPWSACPRWSWSAAAPSCRPCRWNPRVA